MESVPTSHYGNYMIATHSLERLGVDTAALLAEAGIDLKAMMDNDRRVPWETVVRFWNLAVEKSGNPAIGLEVVEDLQPTVYRSLGIALLCSSTLRDFMERFERFYALLSTQEKARLEDFGAYATFTDNLEVPYTGAALGCHCDAFAAFTVKFIRLVYKPDYAPLKVQMAWNPPPETLARHDEYFGCPIEYGSEHTVVHIAREDLDAVLTGANPDIAREQDHMALVVLEKLKELDLPTKVCSRLIEYLPSGDCSRERVARSLAMSESAFQKKLREEGTSYQELLDRTRAELAHHYLEQRMSADEVAFLLGFSDCSSFTRAFKRWKGVTPSDYRKSLSEKSSN